MRRSISNGINAHMPERGRTVGPALKTLRFVFFNERVSSRAPPSSTKITSKTLIRAGASSLLNGLWNRSIFHQNTTQNHLILLTGSSGVMPQLFPSLAKSQTSFNLNETLAFQSLKELPSDPQGLFCPCGLPYLPFFLPDDEPMVLSPKRTYQSSHIKRKRTHGFFARFISLIPAI